MLLVNDTVLSHLAISFVQAFSIFWFAAVMLSLSLSDSPVRKDGSAIAGDTKLMTMKQRLELFYEFEQTRATPPRSENHFKQCFALQVISYFLLFQEICWHDCFCCFLICAFAIAIHSSIHLHFPSSHTHTRAQNTNNKNNYNYTNVSKSTWNTHTHPCKQSTTHTQYIHTKKHFSQQLCAIWRHFLLWFSKFF